MDKVKRNEEVKRIIKKFKPKIKKSLLNTNFQEREDLEQEIKLKITEKINSIKIKNPPSFWNIINK